MPHLIFYIVEISNTIHPHSRLTSNELWSMNQPKEMLTDSSCVPRTRFQSIVQMQKENNLCYLMFGDKVQTRGTSFQHWNIRRSSVNEAIHQITTMGLMWPSDADLITMVFFLCGRRKWDDKCRFHTKKQCSVSENLLKKERKVTKGTKKKVLFWVLRRGSKKQPFSIPLDLSKIFKFLIYSNRFTLFSFLLHWMQVLGWVKTYWWPSTKSTIYFIKFSRRANRK